MTDTKTPVLTTEPSIPEDPDQIVEACANRLMEELFGGIERALDGDPNALEVSSETRLEEQPKPKTPEDSELALSFSEGGLPAVLLTDSPGSELAHLPGVLTTTEAQQATVSPQAEGWQQYWTVNRVLLGVAGLSLLATIALWIHQRQQVAATVTTTATTATEVSTANANAEFLEYLRRSLDVIAQDTSGSTTSSITGVPELPIALNGGSFGLPPISGNALPPPLPPTANSVPAASGPVKVIERVYIPYSTTQSSATPSPDTVPSVVSSSEALPATVHMLVGLLELGDRSAALLEIDGVTQRVYIGEHFGSSGWSLVSVGNEEAVIRRNGEVRSIFIGQQF